MKLLSRLGLTVFLGGLVWVAQGVHAQQNPTRNWATAPRHSSGMAPDPVQQAGLAIVQVYAAPTYGWRGNFAVHPWIIYKRKGEVAYTRYDVVGWRAPQVVQRRWCSATMRFPMGIGTARSPRCWWTTVARRWRP
nr:DUF3750 domain-containing protein [uncultured Rhodoferax sp.]